MWHSLHGHSSLPLACKASHFPPLAKPARPKTNGCKRRVGSAPARRRGQRSEGGVGVSKPGRLYPDVSNLDCGPDLQEPRH